MEPTTAPGVMYELGLSGLVAVAALLTAIGLARALRTIVRGITATADLIADRFLPSDSFEDNARV